MTAALVPGQLRRERGGPGNIGLESGVVLAVYVGTMLIAAT